MVRAYLVLLAGVVGCPVLVAGWPEPPPAVQAVVDQALKSNLALVEQGLEVERASVQLQEARSHFMPRIDFSARYTVASGGRAIDIPVGDLLNGAYSTLNQLLAAQGQPARFASVANQSVPFLLPHEQQSSIRVTQPLYRPEIARGIDAARANQAARKAQFAAYRRALRADVEEAYFKREEASAAVAIYAAGLALVEESLRVNRSLEAHGSGTADAVLRSQAEVADVQGQLQDAQRDLALASSYLNFLLNQPLETGVEALGDAERVAFEARLLEQSDSGLRPSGREELAALDFAHSAAEGAERAAKARQQPALGLALEGGIQGAAYTTGGTNNYSMGSLVLDWNLFDGAQRRSEIAQAKVDTRKAEEQLAQTRNTLDLQLFQAESEFAAAKASLRSATDQLLYARSNFASVSKREIQGMANSLTVLDARTLLTRSELGRTAAQARLFIAAARLDQAATLSPLP